MQYSICFFNGIFREKLKFSKKIFMHIDEKMTMITIKICAGEY